MRLTYYISNAIDMTDETIWVFLVLHGYNKVFPNKNFKSLYNKFNFMLFIF